MGVEADRLKSDRKWVKIETQVIPVDSVPRAPQIRYRQESSDQFSIKNIVCSDLPFGKSSKKAGSYTVLLA
jgi:hypothetical protein